MSSGIIDDVPEIHRHASSSRSGEYHDEKAIDSEEGHKALEDDSLDDHDPYVCYFV